MKTSDGHSLVSIGFIPGGFSRKFRAVNRASYRGENTRLFCFRFSDEEETL